MKATSERQLDPYEATSFQSITGKGAQAMVNGNLYYIGNSALFADKNAKNTLPLAQMESLQQDGDTTMLLGTDDHILAIIAVADQVRDTSYTVIEKLKKLGIQHALMLSGDNYFTANAIANKIGMTDVHADLLPEDKLAIINESKKKYGAVAMVGDGINDAPALATATVGIAMGGAGTDAALETADIALMDDDISKLPYTINLSKRALNIIKQKDRKST